MNKLLKQAFLIAAVTVCTVPNSGCRLFYWSAVNAWKSAGFWGTTVPIPVPPYFSQQIEDTYHEEERYAGVPILDPVEGEHAPLICLDSPTADEVMRALPDTTSGGVPFLAETSRNNVRMIVDLIVDRVDDSRFVPMVGPARLHHCHYKCTLFFEETKRSYWPVPFTTTDQREEVVYIDHDHYIRCAGPSSN
jgi:hypothetical protein